jgi:hypothetical protein
MDDGDCRAISGQASMKVWQLLLIVITFSLLVGLMASNPTMGDYLVFCDDELRQLFDHSAGALSAEQGRLIRAVYEAQRGKLLERIIRPQTVRTNLVLFSLYTMQVAGTDLSVLGIGGKLYPLHGLEESMRAVGKFAF